MANKAAKSLATRNASKLQQTHLITAFLHTFFLLLRVLFYRSSFTRSSLFYYVLCCAPALLLEFWLEKVGRPSYVDVGGVKELRRAGEDLDAKGLMVWMWDVVYWTWGCVALSAVLGDFGWSFWTLVPVYTIWAAYTTYTGAKSGMGLGGDAGEQGQAAATGTSKRQAKMEKRGGQRVAYR